MFNDRNTYKKEQSRLRGYADILGLLAIIFLIRTFGFGLYQVPTGSMETTMLVGERFFADKFTILFSKPKHGEIISFNDPTFEYSDNWIKRLFQQYVWGPSNWTKRVIGVPGDTIKGVIEDGKPVVYRNGVKLDEPYVNTFPLIGIWKVNPLKVQEIMRKELASYGNSNVSQAMLEKIAAQAIGTPYETRSYDPAFTYENQPFYRMNSSCIVRKNAAGEVTMGLLGDPLLIYPEAATQPRPGKTIRKGNSYWGGGSDEFYVELGENEYWLMGDNRRGSYDCRFFGPIKGGLIHGKIMFRILSIQPSDTDSCVNAPVRTIGKTWAWLQSFLLVDMVVHPIDFWKRVRWSRCLQPVR